MATSDDRQYVELTTLDSDDITAGSTTPKTIEINNHVRFQYFKFIKTFYSFLLLMQYSFGFIVHFYSSHSIAKYTLWMWFIVIIFEVLNFIFSDINYNKNRNININNNDIRNKLLNYFRIFVGFTTFYICRYLILMTITSLWTVIITDTCCMPYNKNILQTILISIVMMLYYFTLDYLVYFQYIYIYGNNSNQTDNKNTKNNKNYCQKLKWNCSFFVHSVH